MGHHQADQYTDYGIKEREKGAERLFEEIMAENIPNWKKRYGSTNPRSSMKIK